MRIPLLFIRKKCNFEILHCIYTHFSILLTLIAKKVFQSELIKKLLFYTITIMTKSKRQILVTVGAMENP